MLRFLGATLGATLTGDKGARKLALLSPVKTIFRSQRNRWQRLTRLKVEKELALYSSTVT